MVEDDIPEEDRYLQNHRIDEPNLRHEHDFIDFYCGWGPAKDDPQSRLVWVICKKCLAKRQIRLNMHNVAQDDEV